MLHRIPHVVMYLPVKVPNIIDSTHLLSTEMIPSPKAGKILEDFDLIC